MKTLQRPFQFCMLVALLLAFPAVVRAQFTFTTNNGAITITGCPGNHPVLDIPGSTNGYVVVSIGNSAFADNSFLTSITIPNSVTNIGNDGFQYCFRLTNVVMGSGVASIGAGAFNDCSALAGIIIGPNVTSIGTFAFDACSSLSSVTIPQNVNDIETGAFAECSSLAGITVASNNPAYVSVNGVLFNRSQSTLEQYPEGNPQNSYTISNSVTDIAEYAFFFCTSLTNITLPDSITNIEEQAFIDCFGLNSFTIPNGVVSIGVQAFSGCPLSSVSIGNQVASIGEAAFDDTILTNVVLPNSVTSIGASAFGYTRLGSVTIPASVTNLDGSAFEECPNLTAITVAGGNLFYRSLNGIVFNKSQTMLVEYPAGLAGSFAISNGITSIGEGAFSGCASLTGVTIPGSVTNIGDAAFSGCASLSSLTIPPSVTSLGDLTFLDCDGLTEVYFQGNAPGVVDGSDLFLEDHNVTVYYLPGTTGWGPTFGDLPTRLWNPQMQTSGTGFEGWTNPFGFSIIGASNLVVVVEACTNLSTPVWQAVQTNTLNIFAGTNGTSSFSDPEWTNYSGRFYRLRSP